MIELEVSTCSREDCFLCKNISLDWLEIVRLKRKVLSIKKGEVIFKEGDPVEGIYFILEGKAKVYMSWGDKSYIVRLAGGAKILGHRGYGLDSVFPVSAEALEDMIVCFIPTSLFQRLLRTNPEFLYKLNFFYADELKRTERRMKHLVHMPVKGRLAESLLYVDFAFGSAEDGKLNYSIARKDLASMSGTSYESVIRGLAELASDGLIKIKDKGIWITDAKKLQECCDQHGEQF